VKLRIGIEAQEITYPDGRVLAFTAPARPNGVPIPVDGAYWMRAGEDLFVMTPDMLRRICESPVPISRRRSVPRQHWRIWNLVRLNCFAAGGKSIQATRFWQNDPWTSFRTLRTDPAEWCHITKQVHTGCSFHEITASFPKLTRNQIQSYLKQLRSEEVIHNSGTTKSARWFPGKRLEEGLRI
jgi:hypothetical protein